jgi:hypothetical protein
MFTATCFASEITCNRAIGKEIYTLFGRKIVSLCKGQTGIDKPPNHSIKEMRTQNGQPARRVIKPLGFEG